VAVRLAPARAADCGAIATLRNASAHQLAREFGPGPWSSEASEEGVRRRMQTATIYLHWRGSSLVAMLALSTRKPLAIDPAPFTDVPQPLYLTDMAVHPYFQRDGIGRQCLAAVDELVRHWPADAIRLDAYDAPAGAGEFYRRCGYVERGRSTYRGTRLIYFEHLLPIQTA
jgi:ribosomal protein S18 acetylase RimI-like enzyme